MIKKVLITGGAGFIGSHLSDGLIEKEYSILILDNLSEQVHGHETKIPDSKSKTVEKKILNPGILYSHLFHLVDLEKAFEALSLREEGFLKAIIQF